MLWTEGDSGPLLSIFFRINCGHGSQELLIIATCAYFGSGDVRTAQGVIVKDCTASQVYGCDVLHFLTSMMYNLKKPQRTGLSMGHLRE